MSKQSSLLANSMSQLSDEYTNCPKCGRQYPKNTSATRQQYFCSSCGSDLKQNDIQPLLPKTKDISKEDNSGKYIGLTIATLLLISTVIVIYLTIIDPAASNDPDDSRLIVNTTAPSISPTASTFTPTFDPTLQPTEITMNPSESPTDDPTSDPTEIPTVDPTVFPTLEPTMNPTVDPTKSPTDDPTLSPSFDPTPEPTTDPTESPTTDPTLEPTSDPTKYPTSEPTISPTTNPTGMPTMDPTAVPTAAPTNNDGLVIGLSVGGVGMISIVAAVFVFCFLKRRRTDKDGISENGTADKDDKVSRDYTEIPDEENDEENETTSQIVMA